MRTQRLSRLQVRSQSSLYATSFLRKLLLLLLPLHLSAMVGSEQYILDEYFDDEVSTGRQFRGCVDVRPYCAEIRHRCYRKEDHSWMYAHCPFTCNACYLAVSTDVPFLKSMTSCVHSILDVSLIRDAMGGGPMGIPQYLSSTTSSLQDEVTIEQRSSLIRHIEQSLEYYHHQFNADCQNHSPYCTIWAVLFDRCNDEFYDEVMFEHCPLSCRRCQLEIEGDPEIG